MMTYLDFEKPVSALQDQIDDLKKAARDQDLDVGSEIVRLEAKAAQQLRDLYGRLTPWQKTQVARHQDRPHFNTLAAGLFDDFLTLSGDRAFGDDQAILGGLATMGKRRMVVIGHEKGHDTASRLRHNFGMGKPEGYRKAIRLMGLADRFGLPVLTLVDTSGAFPGIEAEERGQAEAIARSTEQCLALGVPLVAAVVGEGGSGGAIALGAADRVLMFEHAVYSVISPEGCASILWRTADKAADAAAAMRVTAQDLKSLGVIDTIVPEPVGGAHRDPAAAITNLRAAIETAFDSIGPLRGDALRTAREEKFLAIGRL
jgi:acetyl-CoA carboxylase carboxyl transferase subunit alpha